MIFYCPCGRILKPLWLYTIVCSTYSNLLLLPSCKPAKKVRQFPGNIIPSKLKQLIYLWYWYSVHVDFVPKVLIWHWDYSKASSSTYMCGTRRLTFCEPSHVCRHTRTLLLIIILATTCVLFLCWLSDFGYLHRRLIFWMESVVFLWAWCSITQRPPCVSRS